MSAHAHLFIGPTSPGFHRAQPSWPRRCWAVCMPSRPAPAPVTMVRAGSRAEDPEPYEMSVESAMKLLGVSEGDSFDDILRAKNKILATCSEDPQAVAQVEAAYDMLLMQSLTERRTGKVVNKNIRFADVKPVNSPGAGIMPQWLQSTMKSTSVMVEKPAVSDLGLQAGVYGAMMVLTFINGAAPSSSGAAGGADVPGFILATSFGASLYFMTKKNVKLGKATLITAGGLIAGAAVGSVVENWLHVDIVPFLGLRSPAAVISEFIIFSQFLVSLYLR